MNKRVLLILIASFLILFPAICQRDEDFNCFTILVGKNASIDGSVLLGHNEDNAGENFSDFHLVPRIEHTPGEFQVLLSGDSIAETVTTNGYFWITVSKFNAEQYLNEWGVTITSDASRSKETNGQGRIGPVLRKIVAERAHNAREAVKIAGNLIEKYGYSSSGRIYSIADPREAWVFEAVNGKHWIARRVPDDEVVLIPNYYVIDSVNLADTVNFMSSPDIISYAVQQEWYDPSEGQKFNFRKAYCRQDRLYSMTNIARHWAALNILSDKQYEIYDDFPFSFKPKKKVSIQYLMNVLQNHYEGTEFEMNPSYSYGNPHNNTTTMRICSKYNTFSTVVQLREWLPVDIGCVFWTAARHPCFQPYVPWYYGISEIPPGFESEGYEQAMDNYLQKERDCRQLFSDAACWSYIDFASKVDKDYGEQIAALKKWKRKFESDEFQMIAEQENKIILIYKSDPDAARKMLTDLTSLFAERALSETRKKLKEER